MIHYILSLIFLLKFSLIASNHCKDLLGNLADHQQRFIYCSTVHSVPVSLCEACLGKYNDTQMSYKNLKNDVNCSDYYFDKDRINIVATTQSILNGLWLKAYCDDCISNNNYEQFQNKKTAFEDCLVSNHGKECSECLYRYDDLNGYYTNLYSANKGKVCFDIQDSMNRTRSQWSKDLKCCQRVFNKLLFLLATGFVGILPFIFYGSLYVYTKRRESNHDLINTENMPEHLATSSSTAISSTSRVNDLNQTSSSSAVAGGSNNSDNLDVIKKQNLTVANSDDSDEDNFANSADMLKRH